MSNLFDMKLKHLLTNYFYAIGDKHKVWQAFIKNNILTFDLLVDSCTIEILKKTKYNKINHLLPRLLRQSLNWWMMYSYTTFLCTKMKKTLWQKNLAIGLGENTGNGKAEAIF